MPFDDRSGSKALDRSGKLNHGTLYGPAWVAGKRGSALSFDGVNDYVDCGNSGTLDPSILTITAWINRSVVGSAHAIVARREATITNQTPYEFLVESNNKLYFMFFATGWNMKYSTLTVGTGSHYVAVTYNNREVNFYIDEAADTGNPQTTTEDKPAYTTPTRISRLGMFDGYYFKGSIDEVRIYNRALTAAEIKRHYESELIARA